MAPLNLLIVEDDAADVELVVRELKKSGYETQCLPVAGRDAFLKGLVEHRPDIIIYDHNLPQFSSAEALRLTQEHGAGIPFIIVSHAIGDEDAVALMRAGAADYLLKDRLGRLGESVRHALEQRRLREEHAAARQSIVTLNEELALRIAARTAELRVANHSLELELEQRKRAEEALLQLNSELEQRVEERTRDIVASHNRLQALASELTLAEQRERKRLAAELHDYLAQMLALGRMKVAQLRSKLSAGGRIEPLVTEIDDLFKKAAEYTRSLMAKLSPPVLDELGLPAALTWLASEMPLHGLKVDVRLGTDKVALPDDQSVLLFQSVRELLLNVAKHAGTDCATVSLEVEDAGRLRIEVQDQGRGFNPAVPESKPAGSHFGLFSVRERMQAMGGWFNITSAPGVGTTATLSLPLPAVSETKQADAELQTEDTSPLVPDRPTNGDAHRIRVLLVDDHVMVRRGLKVILEDFPDLAVIGEAGDGREALEKVTELAPDLVLMDINMPWMDGIEATRRIKQTRPETPIIALSIDNQPHTRDAITAAGATTFVSKDAEAEYLHGVILAAARTDRSEGLVQPERLS
ncbi:MAG TPA: response regulator [Nitrospira sp.]|mgnify:CR=1 FL=1|nr:response regulator [Nitrospira sp.]